MQFHKPTITANIVLLIIFVLLMALLGMAAVGAGFIIVGGINLLLVFIYLIARNYPGLKTALLFAGICLLIGFSLCSVFALNFH